MERDVRYLTVGLVVLLLVMGGGVFAVWQGGGFESAPKERYTVRFGGGIGGLNESSRVRYRGVEVGRVTAIRLDPDRPRSVRVDIAVEVGTPINRDTVARVQPQGITGLAFIQLTTRGTGPPPSHPASERFPVIEGRSGQLAGVMDRLPQMADRMGRVLERVERLLSDANLAHVRRTLAGAEKMVQRVNTLAERAKGTLQEVDDTAQEARQAFRQSRSAVARVEEETVPQMEATLASVREVGDRLNRLLERHGEDIERFAGEDLAELRRFLRDGRQTLDQIRGLTRQLRQDPSQAIYPPKEGGMEIRP